MRASWRELLGGGSRRFLGWLVSAEKELRIQVKEIEMLTDRCRPQCQPS